MKFEEGKIISRLFVEKNKRMEEIIVRTPIRNDPAKYWKFYNQSIKETEFLSTVKPKKRKDTEKWFGNTLKEIKTKNAIYLIAEHAGKIIGSAHVERSPKETKRHLGTFGIVILKKYNGLGIGKKLTELCIDLSKKEMRLEIIELHVYGKNKIAQNLYEKLRFNYAGKIPRARKHNGKYDDDIIMYKVLK